MVTPGGIIGLIVLLSFALVILSLIISLAVRL